MCVSQALLLLNYIAIAIQHWLRNDGKPLLCCSDCLLTFARAAVPLAMLGISFTIRAYYYDITFNGQVETEGGQSESDIALDSVPGKRSKQETTKETRLSLLFHFSVFLFLVSFSFVFIQSLS